MSAYPFLIGVMSDTHGNRRLMHQAADRLVRDLKAAVLFHLGDNYEDAEELESIGYIVFRVPGLWCPQYRHPRIPRCLVQDFGWATLCAAHADQDLRPSPQVSVTLSGHSHVAKICPTEFGFHLNPGHLKASKSRGEAPSFALLQIEEKAIRATLYEIDGSIRQCRRFAKRECQVHADNPQD